MKTNLFRCSPEEDERRGRCFNLMHEQISIEFESAASSSCTNIDRFVLTRRRGLRDMNAMAQILGCNLEIRLIPWRPEEYDEAARCGWEAQE